MPDQPTKEQIHDALFMSLIFSFQTATMQQLGKIKNPFTDKIERDLAQARSSIEMLDMLMAKTKGNLKDEQSKMINSIISELRLNYIDELNKEQKKAAETPSETKTENKKSTEEDAEKTESDKGVNNKGTEKQGKTDENES